MKIWLDDQLDDINAPDKNLPEGYVGAKTFAEFKAAIEDALARDEKIEAISFDNDLGEGEMEGFEIAKWLNATHPEIFANQPKIDVHSKNPEGEKALWHHLKNGQKNYKELIEAKNLPDPWAKLSPR